MPFDLSKFLVIGVSSRALFDLSLEDQLFKRDGLPAYIEFQIAHENEILKPGAAFPLVRSILNLNNLVRGKRKAEVIIMSRNTADTSLRIFNSLKHHELDITRAALAGGAPLATYLEAYNVDLFLSLDEVDVQSAVDAGFAAALIYPPPADFSSPLDSIHIAFDGDAVLFSEESERIYQNEGLDAFVRHETENAMKPLPDGPFAKLLRTLSVIQNESDPEKQPIRVALVTARNAPAHERAIRTLRAWKVRVDEAHFLGGIPKSQVLRAFGAHMFFDDQHLHVEPASKLVPAARVPHRTLRTVRSKREEPCDEITSEPAIEEIVAQEGSELISQRRD
jgi:5'-nucleotidase